jgi:protein subunit release factor A
MRGDKIRTLSVPNGVVKDHRSGKKMPLKRYLKGEQFGG